MDIDMENFEIEKKEENEKGCKQLCKYCNSVFTSYKSLDNHRRSAKYCLEMQGKISDKYKCECCEKVCCNRQSLIQHQSTCLEFIQNKHNTEKDKITIEKDRQIVELKQEISELKQDIKDIILAFRSNMSDGLNQKVNDLEKRLKKNQPRVQYDGNNFIYILTTPTHELERTYIFGKTVNLTNRLSTYNKTTEHTVVYYRPCPSENVMDVAEKVIFSKLDTYRPDKNRERFVLPVDKTIEFFIKTIDECIDYLSI